jgi:hypothetical protein
MVEVADVCERNSGGFPCGEVEAGGSGSQTATPEAVKQRSLEAMRREFRILWYSDFRFSGWVDRKLLNFQPREFHVLRKPTSGDRQNGLCRAGIARNR